MQKEKAKKETRQKNNLFVIYWVTLASGTLSVRRQLIGK